MDVIQLGDGGSEIKADATGRVAGYLIRFGGADLEGDVFTASTDYGRPMSKGDRTPLNLYYHHGLDETIGRKSIGTGMITMDDAGLWYEAQIDMSDEYGKMIARLAKSGKLGYSSGATSHMVERKTLSDGRKEITRWCIGEASLTPTPCEPSNMVTSKSLKDYYMDDMTREPKEYHTDHMDMDMEMMVEPVDAAVSVADFVSQIYSHSAGDIVHDGIESLYESLMSGMMSALDAGLGADHISGLIDGFASRAKDLASNLEAVVAEVQAKTARPTTIRDVERRLRDAVRLSRSESTRHAKAIWASLNDEPEAKTDTDGTHAQDLLRSLMLMEIELL
jgi:phage head maturation protease